MLIAAIAPVTSTKKPGFFLYKRHIFEMNKTITLKQVLKLANQLSPIDKLRLIENITPQIKRELSGVNSSERKSLRGLWRGANITDENITEMRQEMWGKFPREDI